MTDLAPDSAAEQLAPFALPFITPDQAALLKVDTLFQLAGWYREQGELASARMVLDVASTRSSSQQVVQEQAVLAFEQGDVADAVARLRADAESRGTLTAWAKLARLLLESNDLAGAQAIVSRQQASNPSSVTVRYLAADVALAQGDVDAALATYEATLAETPSNQTAQLGLARIAMVSGDRAAAITHVETALADATERGTSPTELMIALAVLLERPILADHLRTSRRRAEHTRANKIAGELVAQLGPEVLGQRVEERDLTKVEPPPTRPPAPPSDPTPPASGSPPTEEPGDPDPAPPDTTAPDDELDPRVLDILQAEYGYDTLRPGQAAVIANALAGNDTLAIMPTGAGKSLTFQIPALLGSGVTLVISPLIALMKDQFDSLPPKLKAQAAMLNSSQSSDEQRAVLAALRRGELKMIYAAPERLRQHSFVRELRQAGVSLVVVDEAHCISLWGHDFRPDYLTIPTILADLGQPPLLAVTATATRKMADDIMARFGRAMREIRTSVYRPNLWYEAHMHGKREQKVEQAIAIAREESGVGIIYARSRRDTEAISQLLRDRGVSAVAYHAGLDSHIRSQNQERFMSGGARVIVATTAFGMGVNKADVRFIVHLSPPNSLEAYAQESGRAGRDGKRARCVLLATKTDRTTLTKMANQDLLGVDDLRRLYQGLMQAATGKWAIIAPDSLLRWAPGDDDEQPDPRVGLGLLEQAALLRRYADQPTTYTVPFDLGAAIDADTADDWATFVAWQREQGGDSLVRTVVALDGLGWTPERLSRTLTANVPLGLREGQRESCFELLPAGANARSRIEQVLAQVSRQSTDRIAQVMSYVGATRCRHAILANHLSEAMAPCGDNCDICAPSRQRMATLPEVDAVRERSTPTAADATVLLDAMSSLGFNLGKPGWVKLLTGSVESRIRADRSPSFGRLKDLKKSAIEKMLDTLTEADLIEPYLEREYRVYRQTSAGRTATNDDLTVLFPARSRGASTHGRGNRDLNEASANFDAGDDELFEELRIWRLDLASANGAPPYTIAPDTALRAVAAARPRNKAQLADVSGFGPSRVEKYGGDIIAIVARVAPGDAPRHATSSQMSHRQPQQSEPAPTRTGSSGSNSARTGSFSRNAEAELSTKMSRPSSSVSRTIQSARNQTNWNSLDDDGSSSDADNGDFDDYGHDEDDIDTRTDSGYHEDEADEYADLPPEPGGNLPNGFHIVNPYG